MNLNMNNITPKNIFPPKSNNKALLLKWVSDTYKVY